MAERPLPSPDRHVPVAPPEPERPTPWRLVAYETWLRVPELLARAWRGERVRIAAGGHVVAGLVPPADLERLRELDRRDAAGGDGA